MGYVDYYYYLENYGGTSIKEGEFQSYELRSRLQLDRRTFNRIKYAATDSEGFEIPDEVKMCQCALIDYLKDYDANGKHVVSSATVSKQSETYLGVKTFTESVHDIVKQFLGGTPWTYLGGGSGCTRTDS